MTLRTTQLGCYGLALPDLTEARDLFRPVPDQAPTLRVVQQRGHSTLAEEFRTEDAAAYRLGDGSGDVRMDRASLTARFTSVHPLPHAHLAHPYLARTAATVSRWLGRDALHAGAFAVGGGAWGVLGARDSGKSSLLAQVHLLGLPVLTDDVTVVTDDRVLPGPGSIDLRAGAAEHFGMGEPMGRVGLRDRWRLPVPVAAAAPLYGWILPVWGEPGVVAVPPTARLPLLMSNVAVLAPPARPDRFFALAGVPVLRWSRPRDWSAMARATEELLDALASHRR